MMEKEEEDRAGPGRRRPLRRGLRLLVGPLVISCALFAAVSASAGSDGSTGSGSGSGSGSTSIDGAQLIDYREECQSEGCAREEVKELWNSFKEECIGEGCWMEEVAELGGGGVAQTEWGNWYFTDGDAVQEMLGYFSRELDHRWEVADVEMRPGQTDTAWDKLVRFVVGAADGATAPIVTCRDDDGGEWTCMPG